MQSGPLLAFSARGKREGRKSEKLGANRRGLRAIEEGGKAWKVRCKGREGGAWKVRKPGKARCESKVAVAFSGEGSARRVE